MDIQVGAARLSLEVRNGRLLSLGGVRVGKVRMRNPANRFLPWFDSYDGEVFGTFRLVGVKKTPRRTVIVTRGLSDADYPLMERRDCSGDVVLRQGSWDRKPREAELRIVLEAAEAAIDGHEFQGFKYWFEYSGDVAIHRILDRQTWEIGGNLSDVNVVCRNLFDLPRKKVTREGTFSTVGLENWSQLLPGNLWARWSLLPAFDMQYGRAGVLAAWFDRVSCIRTVIESTKGEDWVRYMDFHYFPQSRKVRTNPKTVLVCPDVLDDTDAANLWTRIHDAEARKARKQFAMPKDTPPVIVFSENFWRDFNFDRSYEKAIEVASEFGADYFFIDPVWENGEAFEQTLRKYVPAGARRKSILGKLRYQNTCCTMDFEVAEAFGGEEGLKRLCRRAAAKGIKIISWMATHMSSRSVAGDEFGRGHGMAGVFAARESRRHPDTGYPAECWTLNLNTKIVDRIRAQVIGVCRRTGLAGFLWDSVSNLGWWQVDYSDGTMRPQFDRMAGLYSDILKAGVFLTAEAVLSFDNHSCCGLHGGNVYAGDLAAYAYNMETDYGYPHPKHGWGKIVDIAGETLCGTRPIDEMFQRFANKWVSRFAFHRIPRKQWSRAAAGQIKELMAVYKKYRGRMDRRTVLKGGAGVLWQGAGGGVVLWSFKAQGLASAAAAGVPAGISLRAPRDAATGLPVTGRLAPNRVYLFA